MQDMKQLFIKSVLYTRQVERINILLTLPFRGDARILLVKITRRFFL